MKRDTTPYLRFCDFESYLGLEGSTNVVGAMHRKLVTPFSFLPKEAHGYFKSTEQSHFLICNLRNQSNTTCKMKIIHYWVPDL